MITVAFFSPFSVSAFLIDKNEINNSKKIPIMIKVNDNGLKL